MAVADNKKQARLTFERLFNQGELTLADELVTHDFRTNDAPPDAPSGPAGLRYGVTLLRTAFPDLRFEVNEVIGEEDMVAVRAILHGTHLGPFAGIPATGRTVEQEQLHLVRFVDGKAIEHRAVRDDLGMLRQLGVLDIPTTSER